MTVESDALALPDTPAIPGLAFRRFHGADDWAPMAELARIVAIHDVNEFAPDAETLRVDYENTADLVPARDILLAEVDGRPVAWALAVRQVRADLATYNSFGLVHPNWRRRGIGRTLLRANEAHNRRLAASFDDPGGRVLGAWAGEWEGGATELLLAEGYTRVRWGFKMIRRSLDAIPEAPLPEGLEIREVRDEHLRPIFDADNEAFRDHWSHRESTEEDYRALVEVPALDTSLWSVAWDGDEVVGSVQAFIWKAENEALGTRRGWLERISVRRPWRRQGVAHALIADALRRLRNAGMDGAMLGVDSENLTGAVQLYESLGFEPNGRYGTYRKAWQPGGRLV